MDIIWNGPVYNSTGYANVSRNTIVALNKLGVNVKISDTYNDQYIKGAFESLRKMRNTRIGNKPIVIDHETPRHHYTGFKRNVKMTVFEFTHLPPGWANACNSGTETWVPNQFNVDIFQNSGVHTLHIMEHGVDSDFYNPKNPPLLEKETDFAFLSVFEFSTRKGWDILIEAFTQEFDKFEDVSLIIKTYKMANNQKEFIMREFTKARSKNHPRIYWINKFLIDKEMAQLYTSADCFALPSRAEGWGLPYSEAMASELPTVASSWGGQTSFMNSRNSYLTALLRFEPVHDYDHCQITPKMFWAVPSITHLRYLMRYIFEHRSEARKRAEQGRRDMKALFSWRRSAEKIVRRCEQLL